MTAPKTPKRPARQAADTTRLYNLTDAGRQLGGISPRYVTQLVEAGDLATVLVGRRRMITGAELDRYVASLPTSNGKRRRPSRGGGAK